MEKITYLLNIFSDFSQKGELLDQKIRKNDLFYNLLFSILFFLIFCVVFFLNIKTPMTGDDFVYSFLYQTSHRLSSLNDILQSQYLHYMQWGGRSVVHSIAQALLLLDNPILIDLINSLAFMAFVYVVCCHITGGRRLSISILFIVFTLTWLLQPAFAETTLWITGSANYLWGTLIILLFLLPYRLHEDTVVSKPKVFIYSFLMLLGGVVAGWTNENMAAAMILMAELFFLNLRFKKKRTPLWMYFGILGAIIGYALMITAPGNFIRAGEVSITPFNIVYRTLTYTHNLINFLGVFNLGVAVLLILYLKFTDKVQRNIIPYIVILCIGIFISIYIMVASPGFPSRAWFGTITLNIIIFGLILFNLDYKLSFFGQIRNCILIFCFIAFGFSFYDAYNDVTAIDKIWKERIVVLEQQKADNAPSVTFKEYQAKTKFGLGDTRYALKYISQYYNIDFQLEK